jgi:uncharacterized protein (DUF952 family)
MSSQKTTTVVAIAIATAAIAGVVLFNMFRARAREKNNSKKTTGSKTIWPIYLSEGPRPIIYHMCDAKLFQQSIVGGKSYFPPTFASDGFIHATEDPAMLIDTGNHFYQGVEGEWVCLSLNPELLGGEVIYENPAAVGSIAAKDYVEPPKFPHIYGGIPETAVIRYYPILRSAEGKFLKIPGLVE